MQILSIRSIDNQQNLALGKITVVETCEAVNSTLAFSCIRGLLSVAAGRFSVVGVGMSISSYSIRFGLVSRQQFPWKQQQHLQKYKHRKIHMQALATMTLK